MIAITLGFRASGRNAAPVVLYAGLDATAADAASLSPPAGIIRTELLKNPAIIRRRHFAAVLASVTSVPSVPDADAIPQDVPEPLQLEPTEPVKAKAPKPKAPEPPP